MATIRSVKGREIIDSRGNPTVEVDVVLDDGRVARAAVPSGASTGKKEALELRDNDEERFLGRGVRRAVRNVNEVIGPKIVGMEPSGQREIDLLMLEIDGTANKSELGANAILGVSLAVAHAGAMSAEMPLYRYLGGEEASTLPVPMMNILNGGAHADNNLDFQEFMFIPIGGSFGESLRMSAEVFHALKHTLKGRGLSTSVGDEGGFAPMLESHAEALELIVRSAEGAGLAAGGNFLLALDAAASEFSEDDGYFMQRSTGSRLASGEMIDMYSELCGTYPIASIEDALSETDWKGWAEITSRLGSKIQLVGDDIFVTNKSILEEGIRQGIANAILVKVNQIGSLTETLDTMSCASESGYKCVVSHRSGETEDTSISDISVATGAGQIKTGAPSRGERTAKYNRLLRIEEELGAKAKYPGKDAFGASI
ncbi:MAG: phosphopyruvate hydratase [Methanobacteriota archaeon]|nr:MAG: phosphopyruvate hydratase [Euryarchaeota archaeon]